MTDDRRGSMLEQIKQTISEHLAVYTEELTATDRKLIADQSARAILALLTPRTSPVVSTSPEAGRLKVAVPVGGASPEIVAAEALVARWLLDLWLARPGWLGRMPERDEIDSLIRAVAAEIGAAKLPDRIVARTAGGL